MRELRRGGGGRGIQCLFVWMGFACESVCLKEFEWGKGALPFSYFLILGWGLFAGE